MLNYPASLAIPGVILSQAGWQLPERRWIQQAKGHAVIPVANYSFSATLAQLVEQLIRK
jgi:hypothetical protein